MSELFCQTDLDPPPPDENSCIRASVCFIIDACQPLIYRKECYIVIYLPFRHMQFQLIVLKCMQKCPFYHHETCNETKYFFQQKHEITPSPCIRLLWLHLQYIKNTLDRRQSKTLMLSTNVVKYCK